jgi:hypothetical protein
VKAYFGELQIPIVTSAMNITGVRSLELQAAYRYEEFDNKDQLRRTRRSSTTMGTSASHCAISQCRT